MATVEQAPRQDTADGSWMLWTAAGIVGIWTAVVVVSLLAPDLVSGSEQEHLPLAAMTCWLWGLLATGSYVAGMARLRGSAARRPLWVGLTVGVLAVWLVATVLAVTLPRFETGSDPTRVPLGAVLVPLAAAVVTTLAGIVAAVFARPPEAG